MLTSCDREGIDFRVIQKKFLSGYSLRSFNLDSDFDSYHVFDEHWQHSLLQATVLHPLMKKYSLNVEYMVAFLKSVICELEKRGVDICDELYESYCDLIQLGNESGSTHYRHYMLGEGYITVEEKKSVISQGTTGLCTWQASQALANWCLAHREELEGKCILELGSGVGLTGLAVILGCQPQSFLFSDCHPAVLNLLQSNISLNNERYSSQRENSSNKKSTWNSSHVLFSCRFKNSDVCVLDLPWEEVSVNNIKTVIAPDVVLAADVIYDSSLFMPLCHAFCHLLKSTICVVILVCTVRNEETLNAFVELMKNEQLIVSEDCGASSMVFVYPVDVPTKIYRVTAA